MNIYLLILGMALVTYIPRVLPLLALDLEKIPSRIKTFLAYTPFAAMGALIVPGIWESIPGNLGASIGGGIVSILVSIRFKNPVFSIIGGVLTATLILFWQ